MKVVEFTYDLHEIDAIAQSVLGYLKSKTILFNGDMGSGKTTLIKALVAAMDSDDVTTSPTFSIVNEYLIPNDKIYHFDFYRIESVEEAYNFGIEDYLNSSHWLFIEWAERIETLLPEDNQSIIITYLEDNKRSLKLTINTNHLTQEAVMM